MSFTATVDDAEEVRRRRKRRNPNVEYCSRNADSATASRATERVVSAAERDISRVDAEMRRHVAELDMINEYMHGMLDSLDVGVVAITAEGRVATMNQTAERMLGVTLSQVRGRLYDEIDSRLAGKSGVMEALKTGEQPATMRRALRRSDGTQTFVEATVAIIRDPRNRVIGAVHVLKDLSPVHEMERRLERAARLASIGRMAATLAHEIRNPLAAIAGFSRLLAAGMQSDDPRRRFAENIVSAVDELDKAVGTTLLFARTPTMNMQNLDVVELLNDVKAFVEEDLRVHDRDDIKVVVETRLGLDGHPPAAGGCATRLACDAEQLRRALLNLTRNAVDAMPEGGVLTLRLSCPPALGPEAPMLRVSVADTGTGIAPEIRDMLFEPFETTKAHGTGLGLAVVRKVVELHGGRVSVESRLGSGSTFHIDLPSGFVMEDASLRPAG